VVARTTPNVRAPGIRAAGEKHPQDGDSHRRLIAKTVATPEDFNAGIIDRYLLAVAAHELELYAEAITLLDAALSAGLGDEYASRAERLRAICAVKSVSEILKTRCLPAVPCAREAGCDAFATAFAVLVRLADQRDPTLLLISRISS